MRAFIQCSPLTKLPFNPNVFNAYYGLEKMGFECVFFSGYDELDVNYHSKSEIIVGGIEMIRRRLSHFGIEVPMVDYPEELRPYLKRNIEKSTINTIANQPSRWPIFVKSVEQKRLTGKVIRSISDLVGCGCCDEDYEVYVSEPLNMVAEWRIFVRYGKVLDAKLYKGDWTAHYDADIIKSAIEDYKTAPDAYGIDFAVTDKGDTVLIEVNDGFALGSYGMPFWNYSKFLLTRWAQMTDTIDEFWYL